MICFECRMHTSERVSNIIVHNTRGISIVSSEQVAITFQEDCLKFMVGEKNLSKEDSLTCPNCKSCETKFQAIYTDWPRLLSIQLMRFEMDRFSRRPKKVMAKVTFPTDWLGLSKIFEGVPNYEALFPMYELLSVVAHSGTVDQGHYIAFAK